MGPTALVFVLTYVLIAGRRLSMLPIGRPAGALAGACAMVAVHAVDPRWGLSAQAALASVELNTIGLLLGMMLLAASVEESGAFEITATWIRRRRVGPIGLLYAVTIGSGVLSAFLVNDSVCLLLAPLVDRLARRWNVERTPYLLALAMGSNSGSAMTLAGNPQNMLVAQLSGLSYRGYLAQGGVAGALALLVTAGVLHALMRNRLAATEPRADEAEQPAADDPERRRRRWIALGCLVAVSVGFLLGSHLAWTALAGATVAMLLRRSDAMPLFDRVGWTVLVFFAALFVVVGGLMRTGAPVDALRWLEPHLPRGPLASLAALSATLIVGCQLVSNVPFILLAEPWIRTLPDPALAWTTTAVITTLAGNLTLLGSVANIIVLETTRSQGEIGFRTYMRAGVPVTLASSTIAIAWLFVSR